MLARHRDQLHAAQGLPLHPVINGCIQYMIANMYLGELVMLLYHLRRGHSVKFNPTLIVYRYKPTEACIISYC